MARFVAVNWRDLRNPEAGGAEVHLHEILKRMAASGHEVTLFATGFPGGLERESYDGIDVIRKGSWYNANYVLPLQVRSFCARNTVDLVIEDINKIPFFLPALTKTRVLPVIPHLFGTTVYRETNFLLASYVFLWERLIPWVYRGCRFAVISPSTKSDLIARGIREDRIEVVLCGLDHAKYRRIEGLDRYSDPTIIHFGRIRKYKSIDLVVRAFARIKAEMPNARLLVVGDGPEKPHIVDFVDKLGLSESVRFLGVIKTEELVRLLNQVHVFLNASPKEGWGLTVVEANACGVPVVASDRPGLRDSVQEGETGYLVEYGDVAAFAERSLSLIRDTQKWHDMSAAATAWAKSLTWDRTASEMEKIFHDEMAT
ncbi:MAG: glycosyltransferase family 4 protein [Candidatus Krumholzibacteria bacterium]|nr:glycosyltransferase family 4 protein [Candidatus Krumholzibacteria bacterium]